MKNKITNFIKRVKRLLEWVPVIWKTHDWDYSYTLDILKFQLENQAKYLENGHLLNGPYYAGRIRLALRLMDAAYNGKYSEQVHEEYTERYGKSEILERPADDFGDEYFSIEIWYPKAKDSIENDEIHQALYQDLEIAWDNEKRAKKIFHKILEQDLQKWWD